jgi:hypothetical protein
MSKGWLKSAIKTGALLWPGLVVAGLILVQVQPCWRVTPDSAVYIELGRNLASGRGYIYNEEPFYGYPPVFPALLAVAISLFGDTYLVMRALMAVLALAFLGVSWLLLRRYVGWRVALFLVWLYGLGPGPRPVRFILSDIPGALFAVLALLALLRFEQTDHRRGRFGGAALLAAGATLLAVATRLANLTVVGAVILAFFVMRRDRFSRKTLCTVLPLALVVLGAFVAWNVVRLSSGVSFHRHPMIALLQERWDWDSGYLGPLGLLWRTLTHLGIVFRKASSFLVLYTGTISPWLRRLPVLLFVVGLAVGLVRRRGLLEAFTLCVVLVAAATPFVGQGQRYYLAIGPLLFLYAYEGTVWLVVLVARLAKERRDLVGYAIGCLLLLPVVLMVAEVGPLGRAGDWFKSAVRVAFAVAFAASMLVGLLGEGRLSFRRLFLPVAATILLVVWATVQLGLVVPRISRQVKADRRQAVYYQYPRILTTAAELKRLANPDDVCISSVPSLYRGLTQLRSYWFPFRHDLEVVREGLTRGDWVVLNLGMPPDKRFALPAIEEQPDRFELVLEDGPMRLYRVIHLTDGSTDVTPAPVED